MSIIYNLISDLKIKLRGEALTPEDEGYDVARSIWNAMIDRYPALIIRCEGVSDVIEAVNFSRCNGLPISVKGGGHNVSGNAVCDGGVMIDLSPMKSVYVDPINKTARAEGGATWKEYDRETQVFGLASTGGAVSRTGIAGLTLGGGWGWLAGMHGLACDNLLSADVVTANGEFVTASREENSDLFWGLRGGGGNFGVVTSFKYQLYPVDEVLGGTVFHPIEAAKEALAFYEEFTRSGPDELVSLAWFLTLEGRPVVGLTVCYFGGIKEGEKFLAPLREFGNPVADMINPTTYVEFQQAVDEVFAEGYQNYWKSNFLKDLNEDAVNMIIDHVSKAPAPETVVLIEQVGNQVKRVSSTESAFNHRDARFSLLLCGMSSHADDAEKVVSWTKEFWNAMSPFTASSVYVNYLGPEDHEGEDRVKEAYGLEKYNRLVELKNKYDPNNLFRMNQNIKPTVTE